MERSHRIHHIHRNKTWPKKSPKRTVRLKTIRECTVAGNITYIGSRRGEGHGSYFTSFPLWSSLLQRNVPNKQLYRWSKMVMRKYSLNSNAVGNCKLNTTNTKLLGHFFQAYLSPYMGRFFVILLKIRLNNVQNYVFLSHCSIIFILRSKITLPLFWDFSPWEILFLCSESLNGVTLVFPYLPVSVNPNLEEGWILTLAILTILGLSLPKMTYSIVRFSLNFQQHSFCFRDYTKNITVSR